MKTLQELTRPNIWKLTPYSCARDEFKGEASVFLDANENPQNNPYNRYPDPMQAKVKKQIATIKGVAEKEIFLGVGSDEPIDLLYRAFCEPKMDNVVAIEPTYGMYKVCADINDVSYVPVKLNDNFTLNAENVLAACNKNTKIIWLCSPNNPTGNSLDKKAVKKILDTFDGITVVDEAYIDFSEQVSFLTELHKYPNLVVLHTFSKAWGSAAIRLGMAFGSEMLIEILNKIKYPYNINILTQQQAIKLLEEKEKVTHWVKEILTERERMKIALNKNKHIVKLYATDANFILCKVIDADAIYNYLVTQGIIVRNRNAVTLCQNCIRITIGTAEENNILLQALANY